MRIFQSFAAVVFLLLAFDIAAACSCGRPGAPCNYYGATDAIFVGRVIGSAQRKTLTHEGTKITFDVGTIRFSGPGKLQGRARFTKSRFTAAQAEETAGTGL